jgi:hypothetical protein
MKKLLLFCIGFLLLSFATIGYAQQIMSGARVGVNLANEAYDNLPAGESISIKLGLLAGGQFDYWFNHSWALSIQLLYDQKGANADMTVVASTPGALGYTGTAAWTTSYLELPLLAKLSFGEHALQPYIFAGPSIGFLLSNIEKVHQNGGYFIPDGIGQTYALDSTANISDSTKKIDLSIVAGAGISLTLTSGPQLFLDGTYTFGLTNIDNYWWDNHKGIYVYSRDIRIAAGILFPLN